tara:strand:+ start:1027 stop:1518 length:492 start_codon:yes stop_codon:yes gene_type:complete
MTEDDECPICFEKLKKNVARTYCNHLFHAECLYKWFTIKNTCPLCRKTINDIFYIKLKIKWYYFYYSYTLLMTADSLEFYYIKKKLNYTNTKIFINLNYPNKVLPINLIKKIYTWNNKLRIIHKRRLNSSKTCNIVISFNNNYQAFSFFNFLKNRIIMTQIYH